MAEAFDTWAIMELMGHRKLAGKVREVQIAGAGMLRIDVPGAEGERATQFYSPAALYCLTPCTEETARAYAAACEVAPVKQWELPAHRAAADDEFRDDDVVAGDPAMPKDCPW